MLQNVFLKTLRDQRRSVMWWSTGLACYGVIIMLFWPSMSEMEGLDELIKQYPEELMAIFAGESVEISSPQGFLNAEVFFLWAPLMLIIFSAGYGSGAIAGEEGNRTLDLLVSTPVSRWGVVLQKFFALCFCVLALAFVLWIALTIAAMLVEMEIGVTNLGMTVLSAAILALMFGTLALTVGIATGNRGMSVAVTSVMAIATYLHNAFAPMVGLLDFFRWMSPHYYYIGADPLTNGLNVGHAVVLMGLTVGMLIVALVIFERRDLG